MTLPIACRSVPTMVLALIFGGIAGCGDSPAPTSASAPTPKGAPGTPSAASSTPSAASPGAGAAQKGATVQIEGDRLAGSNEPVVMSVQKETSPFRFAEIAKEAGIDFVHVSGMNENKNFPSANGSGAAIFDYDNGLPIMDFAMGSSPATSTTTATRISSSAITARTFSTRTTATGPSPTSARPPGSILPTGRRAEHRSTTTTTATLTFTSRTTARGNFPTTTSFAAIRPRRSDSIALRVRSRPSSTCSTAITAT